MGLASIPWLTAILSVVGKILHSIWNAAKQHAVLLGVFLTSLVQKLVKLVWSWAARRGAFYILLLTAISTLVFTAIRACWGVVADFLGNLSYLRTGWQYLLDQMPGVSWALWDRDGLFRLALLFDGIWTNLQMWGATSIALFIVSNTKWTVETMLRQTLGKVD